MRSIEGVLLLGAMAACCQLGACQTDPSVAQGDEQYATEGTQRSEATAIGSRELKLLLDVERFADPQAALLELEQEVSGIVAAIDRPWEGTLTSLEKEREVAFFDTTGCLLRSHGFAYRERVRDGQREATLKFRSPDRYLAAAADVRPAKGLEAKTKLEEDLKAPYASVFSHSTRVALDDGTVASLGDIEDHFPGLGDVGLDPTTPLFKVGDRTIQEAVYGPLAIDLGKQEAEMVVTLWYDAGQPVVAELSFKYEDEDENYSANSVRRSMQLFQGLQGLTGWLAPEALTKTAFVYAQDPTLCEAPDA